MNRLEVLAEEGLLGRRAVVVVSRPRDVQNIYHNGYFGTILQAR
jgi:hypothetical protein